MSPFLTLAAQRFEKILAFARRARSNRPNFAPWTMSALALLWLLLAAPGAFAQHGGGGGGHSGGGGGHASSGGGSHASSGASASGARSSGSGNHLTAPSGGGSGSRGVNTHPIVATGSASTFQGVSRWQAPPSRPLSASGATNGAARISSNLSVTHQNRPAANAKSSAYFIRPASSPSASFILRPRPPVGLAGTRPFAGSNPCVSRWGSSCGPYAGANYGYGGYGFGLYGYGFGFPYCFDGMSCDSYGGYGGDGLGYYSGGYYISGSGDYGAPPPDAGDSDQPVDMGGDYIYVNPPNASEAAAEAAANAAPMTVLYLKDGSSYGIRDYWLQDGRLHYVTTYGGSNGTDLDRVDMQRTVDENAKNGVTFTLRPGTAPPAGAPTQTPAPAQTLTH